MVRHNRLILIIDVQTKKAEIWRGRDTLKMLGLKPDPGSGISNVRMTERTAPRGENQTLEGTATGKITERAENSSLIH